jgi:hypothetical protein
MQGIDRVAVDDAHSQLVVRFLQPIASPQQSYLFDPRSYSLTGGERLFPRVTKADPYLLSSPPAVDNSSVLLTLSGLGDFSIYTLTVSGPDIDPFFSSRKLRFRLACDDRFDCRTTPPPTARLPELDVTIDYLAKDYSSFRQALLDFIPTRLPEWTERSEADIGMMLLELFAATADTLSYTQDRVANEAFLGSATQRRSVAGHLALIGYQMDQGASAHTWLQFQVNDLNMLSGDPGFKVANKPESSDEPVIVFETMGGATLRPAHNQMFLYTWDNQKCCLPVNALSAALVGSYEDLEIGDYLLFEDDQGHRDVVRLNRQPEIVPAEATSLGSPPLGSPPAGMITIVSWSATTPLHYDYCLGDASASPPAPKTWVRGNLVPATHGETVNEVLRELTPDQKRILQAEIAARPIGMRAPRQRLSLTNSPLAHLDAATQALAASVSSQSSPAATDPLSVLLTRTARSSSTLQIAVDGDSEWREVPSLLDSQPDKKVFSVEMDDRGEATMVFGDDTFGLRPEETSTVTASYRVGGGAVGNVAADTLVREVTPQPWLDSVTNPLPATGGRDMESRQHARRVGPATSHDPLVAVTATDYQTAAQNFADAANQHPIQRANATFRWTGSWLTVTLGLDPRGTETVTTDLRNGVLDYLASRRLAGYDLEVRPAIYVPLEIVIEFCVVLGFRSADVQQDLQQALSNADLPGGGQGFFHPNQFTFGDNLYVSKLYAAVMAIPGVESAQITRLARLHASQADVETANNLQLGLLAVGPDQIIRLDNDRNFPQNGTLSILSKD